MELDSSGRLFEVREEGLALGRVQLAISRCLPLPGRSRPLIGRATLPAR